MFHGLGALGVAAVLAGCGGSGDDESGGGGGGTGGGGLGSSDGGGDRGEGTSGALATTDEVPVGGGLILADAGIVITQPAEGEFKAFSAVCTHQGNTVTSVEDGVIHCDFHGSAYSAESGEVEGGPAPSPLPEIEIKVEGDQIVTA